RRRCGCTPRSRRAWRACPRSRRRARTRRRRRKAEAACPTIAGARSMQRENLGMLQVEADHGAGVEIVLARFFAQLVEVDAASLVARECVAATVRRTTATGEVRVVGIHASLW